MSTSKRPSCDGRVGLLLQFGVVLSGGPLVLTVHGEDSELLCGAFFQVAPHETWSLRNDQQ